MPARTINHADEIREVYLLAFDSNGTDPVTVEQETEGRINVRFAREILGVLTKRKIVVLHEVNGEDIWQVDKPGSQDTVSHDEADRWISDWLGLNKKATTPTKTKPAKTTTAKAPAEAHDCYCGCGEQIASKAFYRPGHDARHAGVLGRAAAQEIFETGGVEVDASDVDKDRFSDLPSAALVEKSAKIAQTSLDKLLKKANKNAGPVAGIVTVGKKHYDAVRYPDGKVVSDDYGKPLSKTAVASFLAQS